MCCMDILRSALPPPSPRGKGDYYRLGHDNDNHQRLPKRVMGELTRERVVDIACGSLHCAVSTASGKVFAWGDNDEGQIGNDTTQCVKTPTVCILMPYDHHVMVM